MIINTQRSEFGFLLFLFGVMVLIVGSFLAFEHDIQIWINHTISRLDQSTLPAHWVIPLSIIALLTVDIVLPIPSSLVAVIAASTLGMAIGALTIWLGLTLGCCFGYWLGNRSEHYLASRWLKTNDYQKAQLVAERLGTGFLAVMRGVPVLAETSVIAAGMIKYPFLLFLVITASANSGLALAYAYIGTQAGMNESLALLFFGSVSIPVMAWVVKSLWQIACKDPATASTTGYKKVSKSTFTKLLNPLTTRPVTNQLTTNNVIRNNHKPLEAITARFVMPYEYPIHFTNDAFRLQNKKLIDLLHQKTTPQGSHTFIQCVVIIDQGVVAANPNLLHQIQAYFEFQGEHLRLRTSPLSVLGGETVKQAEQIDRLHHYLWQHHVDRHNVVIAIGGGAVLDAVGYACATFHRGVHLLRMPSTVLAQNDAGVGVKNGYNALGAKNLIGTFSPPIAVLNDLSLLNNLPVRDRRAGLAEAVKVAAIRSHDFFQWMEQHTEELAQFEPKVTQQAIATCAQLHIEQITQKGDPFETGNTRPLDYGHWAAHKLESLTDYQVRHGEAVAIGMALDAYYAHDIGLLPQASLIRLTQLLEHLGFDLWHDALEDSSHPHSPRLFDGLEEFRQHLGGSLCITLLRELGMGEDASHIDLEAMGRALQRLNLTHSPQNASQGTGQ